VQDRTEAFLILGGGGKFCMRSESLCTLERRSGREGVSPGRRCGVSVKKGRKTVSLEKSFDAPGGRVEHENFLTREALGERKPIKEGGRTRPGSRSDLHCHGG